MLSARRELKSGGTANASRVDNHDYEEKKGQSNLAVKSLKAEVKQRKKIPRVCLQRRGNQLQVSRFRPLLELPGKEGISENPESGEEKGRKKPLGWIIRHFEKKS